MLAPLAMCVPVKARRTLQHELVEGLMLSAPARVSSNKFVTAHAALVIPQIKMACQCTMPTETNWRPGRAWQALRKTRLFSHRGLWRLVGREGST